MKRTDEHRPSAIKTEDYIYQCWIYGGRNEDIEEANKEERELLEWLESWAEYADHKDRGFCHICGASFMHYCVFLHKPTDTLIHVGTDCAEKVMNMDKAAFRHSRRKAKNAEQRAAIAAQRQAKIAENRERAAAFIKKYELDEMTDPTMTDGDGWAARTLRDIGEKLAIDGIISAKQIAFARSLIRQRKEEVEQQDKPRKPAPEGRIEVGGKLLGIKHQENRFNPDTMITKALIETDDGWKLWITYPSGAKWEKGDRVRVKVTVEPSKKDKYFAFGKNPRVPKE
jgi:hypothetical protein